MYCPFCGTQNHPEISACKNCGFSFMMKGGSKEGRPDFEVRGGFRSATSFLITLREVLFEPTKTFQNLIPNNSIFNALLFGTVAGTLGNAFSTFWQFIVTTLGLFPINHEVSTFLGQSGNLVATLFILPFLTVISLFVGSAAFHLLLSILGAAKQGFSTTFKVVAYGYGATAILGIVPVLGAVVGFFWGLLILIIGLKEAHHSSYKRTAMAVSLPLIACCFCAVLVGVGIAMSGLSLAYLTGLFQSP